MENTIKSNTIELEFQSKKDDTVKFEAEVSVIDEPERE